MDEINSWQLKYKTCSYSNKLIDKLIQLNTIVVNPVDINAVKKAIYYARKYHGDQVRKSGELYYSHPIEVAYLFIEYVAKGKAQYYTTNLVITALLHDVIEDTTLTKEMITQIFSEEVANHIEDLTRAKFNKKNTAGEAVNLLFIQCKKDVLHIKLIDRLHNMQTIKHMTRTKIKRIIDETIAYFIPLAAYLGLRKVQEELAMLCIQAESTEPHLPPLRLKKNFSNSRLLSPVYRNVLKKIYKLAK